VGIFDPRDDTFTAAAAHNQGYAAYSGGTLRYDGRVILAPSGAEYVGIFDLTDNSFSNYFFDPVVQFKRMPKESNAFRGAELMNDGRVVFVPNDFDYVRLFGPESGTFSASVLHNQGNDAYNGAELMRDGHVVFVPSDADYTGIFDPTYDSFKAVAEYNQSAHSVYSGGALMDDGRVAFAPSDAHHVGIFHPTEDDFTIISTPPWSTKGGAYNAAMLMKDGRVIFAPFDADYVGIFNQSRNKFSVAVAHNQGSFAYSDVTLIREGRVAFVPSDADYVGVFDPSDNSFSAVVEHDQDEKIRGQIGRPSDASSPLHVMYRSLQNSLFKQCVVDFHQQLLFSFCDSNPSSLPGAAPGNGGLMPLLSKCAMFLDATGFEFMSRTSSSWRELLPVFALFTIRCEPPWVMSDLRSPGRQAQHSGNARAQPRFRDWRHNGNQ